MHQQTLPAAPIARSTPGQMERDQRAAWRCFARYWIIKQPAGASITVDDMRHEYDQLYLRQPHHPNEFGRAFAAASREGLIEWTGRVKRSSRPSRKGGLLRIWRRT